MNKKYYFLTCSLPKLEIGKTADTTFKELNTYFRLNFNEQDNEALVEFKKMIDLYNLKKLWADLPIDTRGNLDEKGLKEVLLLEEFFPVIVFDYIKRFSTDADRLKNFTFLKMGFIQYQIDNLKGDFLKKYYLFLRNTDVVIAALRSKEMNRRMDVELAGMDKTDFFIHDILLQKDSKTYEPPKEYEKLKDILQKHHDSPLDLYRVKSKYFFKYFEDISSNKAFTIDQLLGYLACLMLVEDYNNLDENQGRNIIDTIL